MPLNPRIDLPCICEPGTVGSYRVGCERHEQLELDRGPTVSRSNAVARTVTYFRAEVLVSVPVRGHDGHIWSQQEHVECEHNHTTPEAAEACAEKLARRAVR